jgi:hypothetical protein
MIHPAAAPDACPPVEDTPSQLRTAPQAALAALARSGAAAIAAEATLQTARGAEAAIVAHFDRLTRSVAGGRPIDVDDDAQMSRIASHLNSLTEAFIEVQACAQAKRAAAAALAAGQARLSAAERECQALMTVLLTPDGSGQAHGAAAEAIGAALAAQALAVQRGRAARPCEVMDAEATHGTVGALASRDTDSTDSGRAAPGANLMS